MWNLKPNKPRNRDESLQFNVLPCQIAIKANFTAPEIYCRKEIQFTNLGTADSFLWDFGVENSADDTSTAQNPVFTFPANGTYTVWQLALSGNCVDSFSRTITIKDPKDYFFAIKDTAICYGDSVNLGLTSSSGGYIISWSPDSSLSSTAIPNPVASPEVTTTYYVTKSYQNCTYTDSVTIKVNYSKADFFWTQFSCKREVAFTNQSAADNSLWDFGVENSDSDTSTLKYPVFTFPHTGTYKVRLVTTSGLCKDSIIKDVTVYSLESYKIDINDTAICYGSSVNLGTDTTRAYKTTWLPDKWLNDNSLPSPLATPQETITYVVRKSFLDCVYTDSVKIIVHNPKAGFMAPDSVCQKRVAFSNTGSADSFSWDFGVQKSENDTSTAKNPVFNFPANGTYKVVLRAKSGNCTDSFSKEITILDPADFAIIRQDTAICYGSAVLLGTTSVNDAYTIHWSPDKWLSDNTIPNPVAKPLQTITYKVTKKFKNCISADSVTITVNNPEVELSYDIQKQCDRNDIVFHTSASDSVKYSWYVNGRIVSTKADPVLSFPYGEKVSGYLLTTAGENCTDTKAFEFDFPGFNNLGFYIPNVITPNGDGENECFGAIIGNHDIKCAPEMYIYNRWGELVFRNDKYCWDGTDSRNGKPLAEGTYFYLLTIGGKSYRGTVTLLR